MARQISLEYESTHGARDQVRPSQLFKNPTSTHATADVMTTNQSLTTMTTEGSENEQKKIGGGMVMKLPMKLLGNMVSEGFRELDSARATGRLGGGDKAALRLAEHQGHRAAREHAEPGEEGRDELSGRLTGRSEVIPTNYQHQPEGSEFDDQAMLQQMGMDEPAADSEGSEYSSSSSDEDEGSEQASINENDYITPRNPKYLPPPMAPQLPLFSDPTAMNLMGGIGEKENDLTHPPTPNSQRYDDEGSENRSEGSERQRHSSDYDTDLDRYETTSESDTDDHGGSSHNHSASENSDPADSLHLPLGIGISRPNNPNNPRGGLEMFRKPSVPMPAEPKKLKLKNPLLKLSLKQNDNSGNGGIEESQSIKTGGKPSFNLFKNNDNNQNPLLNLNSGGIGESAVSNSFNSALHSNP